MVLTCLRKPGKRPRPLGCPSAERRLCAKAWASAVAALANATMALRPAQFAVGVRSGCESIAHGVKVDSAEHPELVCVKEDISNAFGCLDRVQGLQRAAALDAVLAIVERDQYRPPPSRGNTADRGRRDEF